MIPHWLLEGVAWSLAAGATLTLLAWASVWVAIERSVRSVPDLRLGQRLAQADPPTGRVCVVIPAHNESRVIAELVSSLRGETHPQLRIVLALDRCTDDTAALARAEIGGDERFEIIEIDACPAGWAGKVHAVHAGVTRSSGASTADFLLFADADTRFSAGVIAASLALMRHRGLDMLSLLSTLIYDTWIARVAQTAAAFELMRTFPLRRVNAQRNPRAFANGQFMLFTRAAYDAAGGHACVRAALLEDLAFARLLRERGQRVGVFLAAGLFQCSMYGNWAQFRRGWKRIYTEAAERSVPRLRARAREARWIGTILPLATIAAALFSISGPPYGAGWSNPLLALSLAALLVWLGALLRIAQISRAPLWTAPLHLVGAWLAAGLLSEAAADLRHRRPTHWGGREYDLGADGNQAPKRVDASADNTGAGSPEPR